MQYLTKPARMGSQNERETQMKPITLRQAKMMAKKTNAPFSCNILAQNGFFGLSTVFMFHDRFIVLAPWQWETPRQSV
jgi:hypothetical protein